MTVRDTIRDAVAAALPDADAVVHDAVTSSVADVAVTTLIDPIQEWIVTVLHRGTPAGSRFATELATIIDQLETDLAGTPKTA